MNSAFAGASCQGYISGALFIFRNVKKIQLGGHRYKNKPIRGYALVDDGDFEFLNQWKWHLHSAGYATRKGIEDCAHMHRAIMNPPKGMEVDHINGNKLDNRRANLRVCTRAENMRNAGPSKKNKSGYKGVWWSEQRNKWCVAIRGDKRISVGRFIDKKEAALAYNKAAKKYHGEFARLNVI